MRGGSLCDSITELKLTVKASGNEANIPKDGTTGYNTGFTATLKTQSDGKVKATIGGATTTLEN